VAGLRSVSICDFDDLLDKVPCCGEFCCPDVVRFTSLLGAVCDGPVPGSRIGAPEPYEKVRDGESGPKLDLGLPCWDNGRMDSRRIHESLEDTESRGGFSTIGRELRSLCRINECLLSLSLGDKTCMPEGRCARDEFGG